MSLTTSHYSLLNDLKRRWEGVGYADNDGPGEGCQRELRAGVKRLFAEM